MRNLSVVNFMMKISIVTVCYNSEAYIRCAIESILSQSYKNIEYIIIDGASSDKTLDIIREYSDQISCIVSEPDAGIYDAMNKGLKLATGDYIGVLNSDDFYQNEGIISSLVSYIESNSNSDVILGGVDFVNSHDLNHVVRSYKTDIFKSWMLRVGIMPPHPGAFISRRAYNVTGEYRLDFKIGADFEWFVRALLVKRLQYKVIPLNLVRMRVGGISTSGLTSFKTITKEIATALSINGYFSNKIIINARILFKIFQVRR